MTMRQPVQPLHLPRNLLLQSLVFVTVAFLALPFIEDHVTSVGSALGRPLRQRYSGDFIAFYAAGALYAEHHDASPYDLDRLRVAEYTAYPVLREYPNWVGGEVTPFRNPPFYLPIAAYFARFQPPVAFSLMAAVATGLLGVLVALCGLPAAARAAPLASIAWGGIALASYHAWHGILYSQIPAYIAAIALTLGILALRTDHQLLGGAALALLAIKPQYLLPVLLFLFVTRRWDAIFSFVAGGAALSALSVALVGPGGLVRYVENSLTVALAAGDMYGNVYREMYNWRALGERLFADGLLALAGPLYLVLALVSYGAAVWAWRAPAGEKLRQADAGFVLLVLLMLLASPHTHAQDLVFLLPAAALVAHHTWSKDATWPVTTVSAFGLFAVFWLLPKQDLLGTSVQAGVLLLALLFAGTVFFLRREAIALRRLSPQDAEAAETQRA